MMNKHNFVLAGIILWGGVLVFAMSTPPVFGDADTGRDASVRTTVAEAYHRETAAVVSYRDALDGGEGEADLANATITAVQELTVSGYPNASISGRFSASGATAEIVATRRFKNLSDDVLTFKSMGTATLVANTTYTLGGLFISANSLTFDTHGCDVVKILVADPSTGTVEIWAEVH